MIAVIEYTETKVNNVCNKCGSRSITGEHRGPDVCDGIFGPALKKRQGARVKRYRNELKRQKIDFIETLLINCCVCSYGIERMYKPGSMHVIFTGYNDHEKKTDAGAEP